MLITKLLFPFSVLILIFLVLINTSENEIPVGDDIDFMNGVSFVGPPNEFIQNPFDDIKDLNADWTTIMPYAFTSIERPEVIFDNDRQWWGEKKEGIIKSVKFAKVKNLKILLKPHVWVKGQGWTGDFKLANEADWNRWERSYKKYILSFATLADSLEIEAFCIGLEFKHAIKERPEFWIRLIREVRNCYQGKVCYAANWDNFQNIPFWDKVDLIGINAYFPLSHEITPTLKDLIMAWDTHVLELEELSGKYNKAIVFTEYGYRSMDKAAGNQWELEHHRKFKGKPNYTAQEISYQALFTSVWEKPWFKGGFLWKWYPNIRGDMDNYNSDYTPQFKPVEKVIKDWYKKR